MTSTDLQNKIIQFKKNFTIKDDFWVYEQNNFDLFLDEVVIVIAKITKLSELEAANRIILFKGDLRDYNFIHEIFRDFTKNGKITILRNGKGW